MNRQVKREMKKQEARKKAAPRPAVKPQPGPAAKKERTKPRQFIKEVIAELRKVAWPTRKEVWAYFLVVLASVIVITTIIVAMDYVFTRGVFALFGVDS